MHALRLRTVQANKMVADERKRNAQLENDLKDVMEERDAVRSALKLVEEQRRQDEAASNTSPSKPRLPISSRSPDSDRSADIEADEHDMTPTQSDTHLGDDPALAVDSFRADEVWGDSLSPRGVHLRPLMLVPRNASGSRAPGSATRSAFSLVPQDSDSEFGGGSLRSVSPLLTPGSGRSEDGRS